MKIPVGDKSVDAGASGFVCYVLCDALTLGLATRSSQVAVDRVKKEAERRMRKAGFKDYTLSLRVGDSAYSAIICFSISADFAIASIPSFSNCIINFC